MKYGMVFGFFAALSAYYAVLSDHFAFILAWMALSFSIVSLSYFGILKNAFYKTSEGKIPLWSKILNLPFLSYTSIVWHLYRLVSNEPPINRINDTLTVGRRLLASETEQEFDHYIDLTAEFDEPKEIREKNSYLSFPILDSSIPKFEDLIALLERIEGKNLYLHCAQGHGRTGLVALALLLRNKTIQDVDEGLSYLQSFRPALNLSSNQVAYLKQNKNGITSRDSQRLLKQLSKMQRQ